MREPVPEPDRGGVARHELLQPPVLLHQLLEQLHVALRAVPRRRHPRLVDQPLVDEVDAVAVGAATADADGRIPGVLHKPVRRSPCFLVVGREGVGPAVRRQVLRKLVRVLHPRQVAADEREGVVVAGDRRFYQALQ